MRRVPPDPALAQTLRAWRKRLGLSQNAVALAVGVSETQYARYETLRTPVPVALRAAIERALAEAERNVAVPA